MEKIETTTTELIKQLETDIKNVYKSGENKYKDEAIKYNDFWDQFIIDENGNRGTNKSYKNIFNGEFWTDKAFQPPVDNNGNSLVIPSGAKGGSNAEMFKDSKITHINFDDYEELEDIFDNNGQLLTKGLISTWKDEGQTDEQIIQNICYNTNTKKARINSKQINFQKQDKAVNGLYPSPHTMFKDSQNLKALGFFYQTKSRGKVHYVDTFMNCPNLTYIFFMGNDFSSLGNTAKLLSSSYGINFKDCTKLSRYSIINILLNYNVNDNNKNITFNINAIKKAFGEDYETDGTIPSEGNYTWNSLIGADHLKDCSFILTE